MKDGDIHYFIIPPPVPEAWKFAEEGQKDCMVIVGREFRMKESLKSEHAESYPGRPLPTPCTCEEAKPTTEGVKELRDKQLGSNGMIGN